MSTSPIKEIVCTPGYTGPSCSNCCDANNIKSESFGNLGCVDISRNSTSITRYYRREGTCKKCPSLAWTVILASISIIFAIGCYAGLMDNIRTTGFMHILIDFLQYLSFFGTTYQDWPIILKSIFNVGSLVNYDLNAISPPDCFLEINYRQKVILLLGSPLLVACLQIILPYIKMIYFRINCPQKNFGSYSGGGLLISFIYFGYLKMTTTSVETFLECIKFAPQNLPDSIETHWLCYNEYNLNMRLIALCVMFFCFVTIGFLIFLMVVLFYYKFKISIQEDQKRFIISSGTVTWQRTNKIQSTLSCLYCPYKPSFWYWPVVILLKRLIVVLSVSFLGNDASKQMLAISLIFAISYLHHVICEPFAISNNIEGNTRCLLDLPNDPNSFSSLIHIVLIGTILIRFFGGDEENNWNRHPFTLMTLALILTISIIAVSKTFVRFKSIFCKNRPPTESLRSKVTLRRISSRLGSFTWSSFRYSISRNSLSERHPDHKNSISEIEIKNSTLIEDNIICSFKFKEIFFMPDSKKRKYYDF